MRAPLGGRDAARLWRSPNRTWAWRLIPQSNDRTRLDTVYEWQRPLALGTVLLMELADYPMMRRMLLGIRERAEARQATGPESR